MAKPPFKDYNGVGHKWDPGMCVSNVFKFENPCHLLFLPSAPTEFVAKNDYRPNDTNIPVFWET